MYEHNDFFIWPVFTGPIPIWSSKPFLIQFIEYFAQPIFNEGMMNSNLSILNSVLHTMGLFLNFQPSHYNFESYMFLRETEGVSPASTDLNLSPFSGGGS